MRIAFVAPWYLPTVGGVETHVSALAARLAALGHHVEVITQHRGKGTCKELIDGVLVRRFPVLLPEPAYGVAPGIWWFLRQRRDQYDVIHAHSYHAFPALMAAMARSRQLVVTPHYHGGGHARLGRVLHWPYRIAGALMLRRAQAVICVSQSEAALLIDHFPSVASRVVVVPNGVNVDAIGAAEPFRVDGSVLLAAGRLAAYKRVDRLIHTLARLDDQFSLIVVGDGPARAELEALTARLEIEPRVRFLGEIPRADLYRWYRTARIYVTLSEQEAFGLTLLEALAGGAAIVASNIPAHRDVLALAGVRRAEMVGTEASPHIVAEAIGRAMRQPTIDSGSLHIPSWDDVVRRTLAVYAAVMNGG